MAQLLTRKKLIGKGASSSVFKVVNIYTNKGFLALKILNDDVIGKESKTKTKFDKEEEDDLDNNEEETQENQIDIEKVRSIFKECEILRNLNHPNIIKIYGFFYGDNVNKPAILLEYCISNLNDRISKLEDVDLVAIIYEICTAMAFIHDKKIIYRDLKPINILINLSKHVKLCDFGISRPFDITTITSITHDIGTPRFMAPEMFQKDVIYTEKVDQYAFGVVMYFILTKGNYPEMNGLGNLANSEIPNEINDLSRSIIQSCWSLSPEERPSFKDIIELIVSNNFMLIDGIEDKITGLKNFLNLE